MVSDPGPSREQLLAELEALHSQVSRLRGCEERVDALERELQASRQENRELLDGLVDVVYEVDRAGNMLYVSAALETMLGYRPDEVVGQPFLTWVAADALDQTRQQHERVARGEKFTGSTVIVDKHGGRHSIEFVGAPILKDGVMTGTRGVLRDVTDVQRVQGQLEMANSRYLQLFRAMSSGVAVYDAVGEGDDFIFKDLNPAGERIGQVQREDILGRSVRDVFPGVVDTGVYAIFKEVWRTGVAQSSKPHLYSDQRLDVWTSDRIFKLPSGELVQIHDDVTDAIESEQLLQKTIHTLDEAQRIAHVGSWDWDVIADKVSWSKEMYTISGQAPEQGVPTLDTFVAHVHPDDRALMEKKLQESLVSGSYEGEYRFARFDNGEYRYLQVMGEVTFDEQQRPVRHLGVGRDVTEWRQTQLALEESERKYRTLVESAEEEICVIDGQGQFLFANSRITGNFDLTREQVVEKTLWDLFPQAIADRKMAVVHEVLAARASQTVEIGSEMHGKGQSYEATVVPLVGRDDRCTSALVIARNITELKAAQEALNRYRTEMTQAERLASVGTLSAMVAHELSQPLTVIRLSMQNTLAALSEERTCLVGCENLRDGIQEMDHVVALVSRFRHFAKTTLDRRARDVSVMTVIQKTLSLIEESCRRAHLTIHLQHLEDQPPVHLPETDVEQLVFILLENCLQAVDGKDDHHLTIEGRVTQESVVLTFTDDCGGIAPEHLDRIFEPFFTTKSRDIGTGLGLCIADRIIEDAHGHMEVKNTPGVGVSFIITLPRHPAEA